MEREELARCANQLLEASRVRDYCPNRSRQTSRPPVRFAQQFLDARVRGGGARPQGSSFSILKTNAYEQKLSFAEAVRL